MAVDILHHYGFYRAKVLENKDPKKFGRIKIWVPDIMPEITPHIHPKIKELSVLGDEPGAENVNLDEGLWAHPANNPVGGRSGEENNDQWGQGTCYIPKLGSYVWIFFEGGNINRPWYFGSIELETSRVLPENQAGREYQNKWTVFKSSQGRTIIISDDCDERIEITGKKRQYVKNNAMPEGDINSVYQIDGNQTTILLEETEGNEKLLIRTWQGDYINIDISARQLFCYFHDNISIKTDGTLFVEAQDINIKSLNDTYLTTKNTLNIASTNTFISNNETLNLNSIKNTFVYGENIHILAETDLLLTGYETIHQYTSLNLLGGDVNVGLVVPRKAPAVDAAIAGDAGEAASPVMYGDRTTNKDCINPKHPELTPKDNIQSKPPSEKEPPDEATDKPNNSTPDEGLLPDGITVNDVFERTFTV